MEPDPAPISDWERYWRDIRGQETKHHRFEQEYLGIPVDVMDPADDRDAQLKAWAVEFCATVEEYDRHLSQSPEDFNDSCRNAMRILVELRELASFRFPNTPTTKDLATWIQKLRHHQRRTERRS